MDSSHPCLLVWALPHKSLSRKQLDRMPESVTSGLSCLGTGARGLAAATESKVARSEPEREWSQDDAVKRCIAFYTCNWCQGRSRALHRQGGRGGTSGSFGSPGTHEPTSLSPNELGNVVSHWLVSYPWWRDGHACPWAGVPPLRRPRRSGLCCRSCREKWCGVAGYASSQRSLSALAIVRHGREVKDDEAAAAWGALDDGWT